MDAELPLLNVCWTPLAVWRVDGARGVPDAAFDSELFSLRRDGSTLSVVCEETLVPEDAEHVDRDFRALRVDSTELRDEAALARIARALRAAAVRAIEVSAELILVKKADLREALVALEQVGFVVEV